MVPRLFAFPETGMPSEISSGVASRKKVFSARIATRIAPHRLPSLIRNQLFGHRHGYHHVVLFERVDSRVRVARYVGIKGQTSFGRYRSVLAATRQRGF